METKTARCPSMHLAASEAHFVTSVRQNPLIVYFNFLLIELMSQSAPLCQSAGGWLGGFVFSQETAIRKKEKRKT